MEIIVINILIEIVNYERKYAITIDVLQRIVYYKFNKATISLLNLIDIVNKSCEENRHEPYYHAYQP